MCFAYKAQQEQPLIVADSNNAVDIQTIAARQSTPETCVKKNLLRVETGARQRGLIIQETRLGKSDPTQPLPAAKATSAYDDIRVQMAYATINGDDRTDKETTEELEAKEEAMQPLKIGIKAHQELLEQVRSVANSNKKPSTVPFDMTLGGRIRALIIQAWINAEAERRLNRAFNTNTPIQPAGRASTPPDQHEDIKPAKERNPLGEYADFYATFTEQVDRMSAAALSGFF
ncbi:MAG: hypothetical protein Q9209_001092 [Squamulea sp. 1 TL-2023]